MSDAANDAPFRPAGHTVIVVHGTFAGPERNPRVVVETHRPASRYLPNGAFCRRLDAIWTAHDAPWRCWAHGGAPFLWSGANSWTDRVWAGNELGAYIKALMRQGWRCAVVAHSHGGNVLLHALERLSDQERAQLGPVCFIGTPFYAFEGATPGFRADEKIQRSRSYLWGVIGLCILGNLHAWSLGWHVPPIEHVAVVLLSIFGALALGLEIAAGYKALDFDLDFGFGYREEERRNEMLVLHTIEDEAMRFLEAMIDERSPLGNLASVRFLALPAVVAGFRTAVEVDRIRFPSGKRLPVVRMHRSD